VFHRTIGFALFPQRIATLLPAYCPLASQAPADGYVNHDFCALSKPVFFEKENSIEARLYNTHVSFLSPKWVVE
jgi:hypothetical protein